MPDSSPPSSNASSGRRDKTDRGLRAEIGSTALRESFEDSISSQPQIEGTARRRDASIRPACLCARIADEYRGKDTRVLDLTSVTPIFDFFVITTATSARQMRAIVDEVNRAMTTEGSRRIGIEGATSGTWILQDFGDIVLHVFAADARKLYDLENLWADAVPVDWQAYLDGLKSA
jgi:ribosome-associated protein